MAAVFTKKGLSKWGTQGLDISDSGFSKLHAKEQMLETNRKQYDLTQDTFLNYTDHLIEKVNRMYAKSTFTVADSTTPTPNQCFVLTEYTKLTEEDMKSNREARWPATESFASQAEADKACDEQIKASTVGAYIHDSLTETARKQLKADETQFKVTDASGNPFYDGPSYFWKISELVDPNNDSMVEDIRNKLRTMHVKNHGYSIIQMLAEFKNLRTRVIELGGTYSSDEQFLDFWNAIKTMKEKEFERYAANERDKYRDTPKANRLTIDKYMTQFQKKETAMRNENKWNVISPEDSMIMALFSALDNKTSTDTSSNKSRRQRKNDLDSSNKDGNKEPLTDTERKERKESRIPSWKKVAPKEDEPTTIAKDDRTYHWCTKCRDSEGMWALHASDGHKDNFTKSTSTGPKKSSSSDTQKGTKKNVSFQAETTSTADNKENEGNSSEPKARVKSSLMKNARAYLAQLEARTDFHEGGAQQHED